MMQKGVFIALELAPKARMVIPHYEGKMTIMALLVISSSLEVSP